ncbi:MAG: peptidase MA family metallohydrolase [Dehalococcoidia bacterium]|nr:peptidase MA family metallohydrolase [Dehalococcoidia bacterium]
MKRAAAALALLLAMLTLGQALAVGEITVISQTHDNHFPKDITFHLKAQGTQDIRKITFFYRMGASQSNSYVYPTFTPGLMVDAEYVLPTGGARYVAPGSEIEYHYEIEDAGGNKLIAEPVKLTYVDTRFDWKAIQGDQVTVYWYAQEQVARQVFQVAQATLGKMRMEAGESLQRPVKVLVYRNKPDMDGALPFQSAASSAGLITEGEAFSAVDLVMILGSDPDVGPTTAHELTHLITDQLTSNAFSGIPAWLNEGLSMWAEGELRAANRSALNASIRDNSLLNLHTISSPAGKPQEVNLFYGEAYSVVRYLVDTYGSGKMGELLATFKQGTTADTALRKVYGVDVDGLEADWRSSIGASPAPAPAAKGALAQGLSIPTIVPFGPKQPQTAADDKLPLDQGRLILYILLVASVAVLSIGFLAGVVFVRRKQHGKT